MSFIVPTQLTSSLTLSIEPLYIIYGEEDLIRVESLDNIRFAAKSHGYIDKEVFYVDHHFDWNEFLFSLDSLSLFSEKKLIELHVPTGKPGNQGSEILQKVQEKISQDYVIVIIFPKLERLQQQSKWFKSLSQVAVKVEAKKIDSSHLAKWIKERLELKKLYITEEALSLFSERLEGNLLAAKQEIDKLALIYENGYELSLDDILTNIIQLAKFDIFELSSTWMRGNKEKTIILCDELKLSAAEPVLLNWLISEDIRVLLRVQAILQKGGSIQSVKNSLRLWGDKQESVNIAVKRIQTRTLMSALKECARIDRIIKGVDSDDIWSVIKSLLIQLAS